MKKFPVTIVDNFYENPELVREFALSQKFIPSDGVYPGKRTDLISNLNRDFFNTFCTKLLSLFYDLNSTELEWNISTSFQKIGRLSENKESKFNEGWIHPDQQFFSGIVYLSKDSIGTNIYEPIDPSDFECHQEGHKNIFFSGKDISEEEYSEAITKNNSKFKESIRIYGKFNRLVLFEGGVLHGVPSFYCQNEERLTQVFFCEYVNTIDSNDGSIKIVDPINYPIIRSKVRYN